MSRPTTGNAADSFKEKPGIMLDGREIGSSNASIVPGRNVAFQPPSRYMTTHTMEIDDYFAGPRDMQKHSKLPFFMRIHGSVLPRMILPLSFVGLWATTITCISKLTNANLGMIRIAIPAGRSFTNSTRHRHRVVNRFGFRGRFRTVLQVCDGV